MHGNPCTNSLYSYVPLHSPLSGPTHSGFNRALVVKMSNKPLRLILSKSKSNNIRNEMFGTIRLLIHFGHFTPFLYLDNEITIDVPSTTHID